MDLLTYWSPNYTEAGCDEAGRGCLCGPVVAAAVILPKDFTQNYVNDSKKINSAKRKELDIYIKENVLDFAIAEVSVDFIDRHNILNASIHAMHLALDKLKTKPEHILVDGNRFKPYNFIPHQCVVGGDGRFLSIAAASILAKNHRDRLMLELHEEHPEYGWDTNFGYATKHHREALVKLGPTPYHRTTFRLDYS